MYNPLQPNVYRTVRIEREKQRREKRRREVEEEARQRTAADAERRAAMPFSLGASLVESVSSSSWLGDDLLGSLDAETLVKERLKTSAAMGVASAQEILRDEEEVRHKEHVQQGKDMGSKIGKLLGKLNQGAASATTAHLVFTPASLGAGGHVITKASESASDQKKPIRGKPSSTIFFHLASNAEVPLTLVSCDELLGPWVCQSVLQECGKCGVVRSSLRWTEKGQIVGDNDAPAPVVPSRLPTEDQVRVFVKFDSVASAFKAAERWDSKPFDQFCKATGLVMPSSAVERHVSQACLRVCFYPTPLYDSGAVDHPVR